jgi:hypothetical protein
MKKSPHDEFLYRAFRDTETGSNVSVGTFMHAVEEKGLAGPVREGIDSAGKHAEPLFVIHCSLRRRCIGGNL